MTPQNPKYSLEYTDGSANRRKPGTVLVMVATPHLLPESLL